MIAVSGVIYRIFANVLKDFEINAFLNQDSYRLLKFVSDLVSIPPQFEDDPARLRTFMNQPDIFGVFGDPYPYPLKLCVCLLLRALNLFLS